MIATIFGSGIDKETGAFMSFNMRDKPYWLKPFRRHSSLLHNSSFVWSSATSAGGYATIIYSLPSLCLKWDTNKWPFCGSLLWRTCQKHVGIARSTLHCLEPSVGPLQRNQLSPVRHSSQSGHLSSHRLTRAILYLSLLWREVLQLQSVSLSVHSISQSL